MLTAVNYQIAWHDLNVKDKGLNFKPAREKWIANYVDLMLMDGLKNTLHRQYLTSIFLPFLLTISQYKSHCDYSYTTSQITATGTHAYGPCGVLDADFLSSWRLPYYKANWTIDVVDNLKVNLTILKINIPYVSIDCPDNSVDILDTNDDQSDYNNYGTFCGYCAQKIFYTRFSSVVVQVALVHLARSQMSIKLAYQGYASSIRVFQSKRIIMSYININRQQFDARFFGTNVNILYYRTYVFAKIEMKLKWRKCQSESSKVNVFDGPSSKSSQIGSFLCDVKKEAITLTSSLFTLTIHTMGEYRRLLSFNRFIEVYSVSRINQSLEYEANQTYSSDHTFHIGARETFTKKLHLQAAQDNVYESFEVIVPSPYFVNLRISEFVYNGYTEAACYLGGLILRFNRRIVHGPLCGVYGNTALRNEHFDGLTTGAHRLIIIVYLYREAGSDLFLTMNFQSDKCEGLINPCHIDGRYGEVPGKNFFLDTYNRDISVHNMSPDKCIKIQGFFDNMIMENTTRSCLLELSSQHLASVINTETMLVSEKTPNFTCDRNWNYNVAASYYTGRQYHNDARHKAFKLEFTSDDSIIESIEFEQYLLIFNLQLDIGCLPEVEAAYKIIVSTKPFVCNNYTLMAFEHVEAQACSNFFSPTLLGLQTVTIPYKNHEVNLEYSVSQECMDETHIPLLLHQSTIHFEYGHSHLLFFWKIQSPFLRWSFFEGENVKLHIFKYFPASFNISDILNSLMTYNSRSGELEVNSQNVLSYYESLNISESCRHNGTNLRWTLKQFKGDSKYIIDKEFTKKSEYHKLGFRYSSITKKMYEDTRSESGWKTCYAGKCYFVSLVRNTSSQSALANCKKRGLKLLTVKSNFVYEMLNKLMHLNKHVAFSHMLFLGLKRDRKVSY